MKLLVSLLAAALITLAGCGGTRTVTTTVTKTAEQPPASAAPAADEPMLEVDYPAGSTVKVQGRSITVRGRATPGSELLVANLWNHDKSETDYSPRPDESGRWKQNVTLHPGNNDLFISRGEPGYDLENANTHDAGYLEKEITIATPQDMRSSPSRHPSLALSFTGNGGKRLGTVTVPRAASLSWTNDGQLFQIFDDAGGVEVNSEGHSGTSAVASGTYRNVQVNAVGNWTIKIR